jgi:tRNA (adenine37-N6)-methyltransferase
VSQERFTPPVLHALELDPIGVAHTPFRERAEAPRQPRASEGTRGRIELFPGRGFEDALDDLQSWERIWVIFWFHRNEGWRPKVHPPRSEVKRGVFATRAPRRPNPLGLSVLRLDAVEGLTLHVRDVDLLDGTPVLDIKPYVAWCDAIPDAAGGWLEINDDGGGRSERTSPRPDDPQPDYEIVVGDLARAQLQFLDDEGVRLERRIRSALALGPRPHAYRRIRPEGDGYRIAVKDWRARFTVAGRRIEITEILSGYRPAELHGHPERVPEAHRRFVERFGFAPS